MNIDDLAIGQARELAAMFQQHAQAAAPHPFVGRYCILRCYSAGVHAGTLVSASGDQAILKNSRRLWKWKANAGIALSGVAQHGICAAESKLDSVNPEIALTGVIEIIPATIKCEDSING